MTPEQVRGSHDSVIVRLYDDDDGGDGGVNGYKFFTKKCFSNLSYCISVCCRKNDKQEQDCVLRGTRLHFITYLFLLCVPLFYFIFAYFLIKVYFLHIAY